MEMPSPMCSSEHLATRRDGTAMSGCLDDANGLAEQGCVDVHELAGALRRPAVCFLAFEEDLTGA